MAEKFEIGPFERLECHGRHQEAELGGVGGVRVWGVESRACFAESCAQLGTLYVHRDADPDGLTRIVGHTQRSKCRNGCLYRF